MNCPVLADTLGTLHVWLRSLITMTSSAVTATTHKLIGRTFPVRQVCPSHRTGGNNVTRFSAVVLFLVTTEHQRWESAVLSLVSVGTRAVDTNQGVKLGNKKNTKKHSDMRLLKNQGVLDATLVTRWPMTTQSSQNVAELLTRCSADAVSSRGDQKAELLLNCSIMNTMTRKMEITPLTITNVSIWKRN